VTRALIAENTEVAGVLSYVVLISIIELPTAVGLNSRGAVLSWQI